MNVRTVNQLGRINGADYVSGTTAQTGKWQALTALEATVIATLTAGDVGGTLTAIPLPAGATIFGTFTGFTLTSGKVWATRQA